MNTTPQAMKSEFTELFSRQKQIENNARFQEKKKAYNHIKLESNYDCNTLSEIFQDPALLERISEEAHLIMTLRADRESRIRSAADVIVKQKPQAKDVIKSRVIDEVDQRLIQATLEKGHAKLSDDTYMNPLAPKKRFFLSQEQHLQQREEAAAAAAAAAAGISEEMITTTTALEKDIISTINSNSLIISPRKSDINDNDSSKSSNVNADDYNEKLNKIFEETSILIKESPLKSVGSECLYSLLPRQCETGAYRYVKEDYILPKKVSGTNRKVVNGPQVDDETLVTITIYNPDKPNLKIQQIEILGSQTFSNLRDAIYCLSDFSYNGDRKNRLPQEEIINTPEKKLSQSMFYINHVFYVDTRHIDNSKVGHYKDFIEDWLSKKKVNMQIFQYKIEPMAKCKLETASFELDQPLVFLHQDSCEHMFLINDVRLLSKNEYKSKQEFPRTTYNLRYDRYKCFLCTIYPATKITVDDLLTGFSPCYFCDLCFQSFHKNNTNIIPIEYFGTPKGSKISEISHWQQKSAATTSSPLDQKNG